MYFCTIYHKTVATALLKALTQWGSHIVVAVKPIWELYNNKARAPPAAGRRKAECVSVILKAPPDDSNIETEQLLLTMGSSRHHAET